MSTNTKADNAALKKVKVVKTAKNQLTEQIKFEMAAVAAKIFRQARKNSYASGGSNWIEYASRKVVNEITDRMFAMLHQIAVVNQKQRESKVREVGKNE